MHASDDASPRARLVALDELVLDPQLSEHTAPIGLQEESALIAMNGWLEQDGAFQAGR
jgi:hypothetical protein